MWFYLDARVIIIPLRALTVGSALFRLCVCANIKTLKFKDFLELHLVVATDGSGS